MVFHAFREKYASLGRFAGNIRLSNLTLDEITQLEGVMHKNYHGKKSITITATALEKVLAESRFAQLTWKEILEGYFGQPLIVKQDVKEQQEAERDNFFQSLICEKQSAGTEWIVQAMNEKSSGYFILVKQYNENRNQLQEAIRMFLTVVEQLPIHFGKRERLPVFAAKVTGNPHALDDGTLLRRLLDAFLAYNLKLNKALDQKTADVEWKNQLLYHAGLIKEGLSNDILVYGIQGEVEQGKAHLGLLGFYQMQEPIKLTLLSLSHLIRVQGNQDVYVLENPAVFSELIQKYPDISAVCICGQPGLAAWVLLDLLCQAHILWYAGDFDPEGLMIAQTLKKRYGDCLNFWDYQSDYYIRALSDVQLSQARLKKLENIDEEELQEIKKAMLYHQKAAYQEKMLEFAYQIND